MHKKEVSYIMILQLYNECTSIMHHLRLTSYTALSGAQFVELWRALGPVATSVARAYPGHGGSWRDGKMTGDPQLCRCWYLLNWLQRALRRHRTWPEGARAAHVHDFVSFDEFCRIWIVLDLVLFFSLLSLK